MVQGLVQVYTGNGKGKTTAAFGLALRAAGAGLQVFIAQFVKGMDYSELDALRRFDEITLKQFGTGCFIFGNPADGDIRAAQDGFQEVKRIIASGSTDVVILDEINIATHYGLVSVDDVLDCITSKPHTVELVLTGRYADERITAAADLVTEMREVKHYYGRGVEARTGIEK